MLRPADLLTRIPGADRGGQRGSSWTELAQAQPWCLARPWPAPFLQLLLRAPWNSCASPDFIPSFCFSTFPDRSACLSQDTKKQVHRGTFHTQRFGNRLRYIIPVILVLAVWSGWGSPTSVTPAPKLAVTGTWLGSRGASHQNQDEEAITCRQEMLTRFSKWDRGSILFSSDSETEKTRQCERGRLREAVRGWGQSAASHAHSLSVSSVTPKSGNTLHGLSLIRMVFFVRCDWQYPSRDSYYSPADSSVVEIMPQIFGKLGNKYTGPYNVHL